MIEILDNTFQLVVGGICILLAGRKFVLSRRKEWMILLLVYCSFSLGNLYWLLYLLFYQRTPQYFYIADFSWWAGYLFLILLLKEVLGREKRKSIFIWVGPVFTAGMCIFFMQWGQYLSNIIYATLMGIILYYSIQGLLPFYISSEKRSKRLMLCVVVLFTCLMEYAEWTASCFWTGDSLKNPYFWFDTFFGFCFPLYLPAVRRAVER